MTYALAYFEALKVLSHKLRLILNSIEGDEMICATLQFMLFGVMTRPAQPSLF